VAFEDLHEGILEEFAERACRDESELLRSRDGAFEFNSGMSVKSSDWRTDYPEAAARDKDRDKQRKNRYATDPAYRERVKAAALARYHAKRAA
jgi:hypothetical protein